MLTRIVPSFTGSTDPTNGYDLSGSRVRSPEDVLRQARATSITGVLGQIASVASYSLDILRELKDEATEVQDRMTRLNHRVDVLAQIVDSQLQQRLDGRQPAADLMHLLPSQEESDRVLCIQTISAASISGGDSKSERPAAIVEAYERCERMPPLELLDSFYDNEQRSSSERQSESLQDHDEVASTLTSSISRKKYSHPGFFMEEWLKNEATRQQRALEIKEERRRERREAQKAKEQQRSASADAAKTDASNGDAEQKMKFLKIRSWREIYGTGEGKELMKQQQQQLNRSPTLRDLRKKAHQSFASITHSPTRAEERQHPTQEAAPSPPPTTHHAAVDAFGNDQLSPPSPVDPHAMSAPVSGAFMQEMDDDEITTEMEEEFTNGIPPPPPPLPDATSPDEFTDHGLSYYYDPSAPHNLVPPPPLPELDEQSRSDTFFDAYDVEEADADTPPPPPPPPMEEYEQPTTPPPPPPSPPRLESPRPNLLEEIQLGKSLRSASEPRPQREVPAKEQSPQTALLQQILQKQSRHLRPVETRRPPSQPRPASSGAPFADSIARILERRTMIAYDSDSGDSRKSGGSNNDDDDW
ncbi:Cytochrome b5 domain-containing protein 1 [Phytophthora boehmeriae]|uniref:Cytochrome b5 domain-containing protein 1 n=1 Tax=Phytophthora boehmeriae TaxID=109152 RepID=A0A8T1WZY1_9STRA|nr:Cytochrome b5 domain-containing protein 1 [Phytophthora boehmeriae]